jgi:hypothetical protein
MLQKLNKARLGLSESWASAFLSESNLSAARFDHG